MSRRKAPTNPVQVVGVAPAAAVPPSSPLLLRPVSVESLMFLDHRRNFRAQRPGEQAIEAFHEADKIDQLPRQVQGDDVVYQREAAKFRQVGADLLRPSGAIARSPGKEAISWDNGIGAADSFTNAAIVETLEQHPTTVAVGASGKRTEAVYQAGILEPALDAAESAQASNSIEKMLCHQMAAAHFTVMRLLAKADETTSTVPAKLQPGEVVRYTNAAARIMDVYQNGCLTLQKLKTRGTQRIEVCYQQVNVGAGGQVVVTEKAVARGSRTRWGRSRK